MATVAQRGSATRNAFRAIAGDLQKQIAQGDLTVGRYLPTERELQDQFNVSRSTIRRALAHLVEQGWAHNVPSKGVIAGSGLRPLRSRRIALLDNNCYVTQLLLASMKHRFHDMGFELVHIDGVQEVLMEDAMRNALEDGVAGIIVWPYQGFPDIDAVRDVCLQIPVVCLEHRIKGTNADLVTFDHFEMGRLATEHLIRNGCRKIAVTGMMDMLEATHERFSGFMKAMFDNHLRPEARNFLFCRTSAMDAADPLLPDYRLRQSDRPDGLLVLQDEYAPLVVETVLRAGHRPPEDIKLMSIGDDVDITVNQVGMSAIALDLEGMVQLAIELLLRRIEDPMRTTRTALANHKFAIRGLCGSPKTVWNVGLHDATAFHGELPIPRKQFAFRSHWSVEEADTNSHRGGILK